MKTKLCYTRKDFKNYENSLKKKFGETFERKYVKMVTRTIRSNPEEFNKVIKLLKKHTDIQLTKNEFILCARMVLRSFKEYRMNRKELINRMINSLMRPRGVSPYFYHMDDSPFQKRRDNIDNSLTRYDRFALASEDGSKGVVVTIFNHEADDIAFCTIQKKD